MAKRQKATYLSASEVKRYAGLKNPEQVAIAKRTGVSISTVYKILRGQANTSLPSAEVVLAEADKMI